VTVYRWVQRFTPLFVDAARPVRHAAGDRSRSAAVIATGHAFVQNLRRGHYELAPELSPPLRLARAFSELALSI
jgi:hypothetical protein